MKNRNAFLLASLISATITTGFVPSIYFWNSLVCAQELNNCPSSERAVVLQANPSPESQTTGATAVSTTTMPSQHWFQHVITVTAPSRGCHLITGDILKAAGSDIQKLSIGMCNVFVQHTSASLTINENADPDVRTDMETALNKIVPAEWNRNGVFRHTMEGDDGRYQYSAVLTIQLNHSIAHRKILFGCIIRHARTCQIQSHGSFSHYSHNKRSSGSWNLAGGKINSNNNNKHMHL
jgi:secondary thiamine-phosphate synthase enzyme